MEEGRRKGRGGKQIGSDVLYTRREGPRTGLTVSNARNKAPTPRAFACWTRSPREMARSFPSTQRQALPRPHDHASPEPTTRSHFDMLIPYRLVVATSVGSHGALWPRGCWTRSGWCVCCASAKSEGWNLCLWKMARVEEMGPSFVRLLGLLFGTRKLARRCMHAVLLTLTPHWQGQVRAEAASVYAFHSEAIRSI